MASGSLLDPPSASSSKHKWSSDSKFYTRKKLHRPQPPLTSPLPPPPPDVTSSTPPPPPPTDINPENNNNHIQSNGQDDERTIKIHIDTRTKHELRTLRRQLIQELTQVRSLFHKLEAVESQFTAPPPPPPLPPPATNGYTRSQHSASDDNNNNDIISNNDIVAPVPVPEHNNNNNNNATESVVVDKRTPKANQYYYHNNEFLLIGKDKLFPPKSAQLLEKKYTQAFKSCSALLSKLMKHQWGWVFNTPVDVKGLGLHDYYSIIKHPMDLGTVKSRLNKNWYKTPGEFAEDVRLTFSNAMTYNPKDQDVHIMAKQLLQIFEERWPAIEAEYAYVPPPTKKTTQMIDARMLERSDSTANHVVAVEPKPKPVSYSTHIGRPALKKPKPKAKDLYKREMTMEEKQKLSTNLQNLPSEKLDSVVQIIKRRHVSLSQHDDEIEVDIDSVDTETLWELDRFVVNYKKSLSKNKRKAEMAVLARAEAEKRYGQERVQESGVGEGHKENHTDGLEARVVEKEVAPSSPVGGENKRENSSRASSSSSSSSGSGSSSSDSDSDSSSAYGSDAAGT